MMMVVGKGFATVLSEINLMFSLVNHAYFVDLVDVQGWYSQCRMLHDYMKVVIPVFAWLPCVTYLQWMVSLMDWVSIIELNVSQMVIWCLLYVWKCCTKGWGAGPFQGVDGMGLSDASKRSAEGASEIFMVQS